MFILQVTRLVIVVVSVFALCWLPVHFAFLVQFLGRSGSDDEGDEESLLIAFKIGAQCLAYLNSCVNPVLYAFLSEQFRRSFKKLIGRCFPSHDVHTKVIEREALKNARQVKANDEPQLLQNLRERREKNKAGETQNVDKVVAVEAGNVANTDVAEAASRAAKNPLSTRDSADFNENIKEDEQKM